MEEKERLKNIFLFLINELKTISDEIREFSDEMLQAVELLKAKFPELDEE
jgi:hypothetical protein